MEGGGQSAGPAQRDVINDVVGGVPAGGAGGAAGGRPHAVQRLLVHVVVVGDGQAGGRGDPLPPLLGEPRVGQDGGEGGALVSVDAQALVDQVLALGGDTIPEPRIDK